MTGVVDSLDTLMIEMKVQPRWTFNLTKMPMIIESVVNLEAVLMASFTKRCEIKAYLISRGTKVTWLDQVPLVQHQEIKQMQELHRNAAVQQDLLRRSQSLEVA